MPAVGVPQGPPWPLSNAQSPTGAIALDPATGAIGSPYMSNYTVVSSAGTTTVKTTPGSFNGVQCTALGTSFAAVVYDIGTATNIIAGTATFSTVGQTFGFSGGGIRTTGALVVVTSGTAGSLIALWD